MWRLRARPRKPRARAMRGAPPGDTRVSRQELAEQALSGSRGAWKCAARHRKDAAGWCAERRLCSESCAATRKRPCASRRAVPPSPGRMRFASRQCPRMPCALARLAPLHALRLCMPDENFIPAITRARDANTRYPLARNPGPMAGARVMWQCPAPWWRTRCVPCC